VNEGTRAKGLQGGATPNGRFDSFPSPIPMTRVDNAVIVAKVECFSLRNFSLKPFSINKY
jgi:hypothetical protein